jgi:hypothetical protein
MMPATSTTHNNNNNNNFTAETNSVQTSQRTEEPALSGRGPSQPRLLPSKESEHSQRPPQPSNQMSHPARVPNPTQQKEKVANSQHKKKGSRRRRSHQQSAGRPLQPPAFHPRDRLDRLLFPHLRQLETVHAQLLALFLKHPDLTPDSTTTTSSTPFSTLAKSGTLQRQALRKASTVSTTTTTTTAAVPSATAAMDSDCPSKSAVVVDDHPKKTLPRFGRRTSSLPDSQPPSYKASSSSSSSGQDSSFFGKGFLMTFYRLPLVNQLVSPTTRFDFFLQEYESSLSMVLREWDRQSGIPVGSVAPMTRLSTMPSSVQNSLDLHSPTSLTLPRGLARTVTEYPSKSSKASIVSPSASSTANRRTSETPSPSSTLHSEPNRSSTSLVNDAGIHSLLYLYQLLMQLFYEARRQMGAISNSSLLDIFHELLFRLQFSSLRRSSVPHNWRYLPAVPLLSKPHIEPTIVKGQRRKLSSLVGSWSALKNQKDNEEEGGGGGSSFVVGSDAKNNTNGVSHSNGDASHGSIDSQYDGSHVEATEVQQEKPTVPTTVVQQESQNVNISMHPEKPTVPTTEVQPEKPTVPTTVVQQESQNVNVSMHPEKPTVPTTEVQQELQNLNVSMLQEKPTVSEVLNGMDPLAIDSLPSEEETEKSKLNVPRLIGADSIEDFETKMSAAPSWALRHPVDTRFDTRPLHRGGHEFMFMNHLMETFNSVHDQYPTVGQKDGLIHHIGENVALGVTATYPIVSRERMTSRLPEVVQKLEESEEIAFHLRDLGNVRPRREMQVDDLILLNDPNADCALVAGGPGWVVGCVADGSGGCIFIFCFFVISFFFC